MPESTYPRAVLFGADEFDHSRSVRSNTFGLTRIPFSRFYRYTPALIATELYELAFALKSASTSDPQTGGSTPSSGRPSAISGVNNPHGTSVAQGPKPASMFCLPHFQAYKLQHAWWLVDCGQTALASRYCDAILGILATLPQGVAVPYIHSSLVQGLRDLRERLSGAGMTSIRAAEMAGDTAALTGANSKSWLARAMPRPSFASLMTVFDSSIDKFITGADGSRISLEPSGSIGKFEVGPDRHSFDYQSSHGSRQQHQPPHSPPRPLGAVSLGGRTPSPYLAAATATSSTFEQIGSTDAYIPSYGSPRQSMDGRPSNGEFNIHGGMGGVEPPRMFTPSNISSSYTDSAAAPGASQQFVQQIPPPQWGDPKDFGGSANGHGQFIDPTPSFGADPNAIANHVSGMASSMPPIAPEPVVAATPEENGDEEDIFGFSKRPSTQTPAPGSARQSTEASRKSLSASVQSPADAKDDTADAGKKDSEPDDKAGSGVIGMLKSLWGGRRNQANLGEESNFVYDPELKRWVDKNAPDSQKNTGPPPPPPPSMMRFQPQSASVPPPSVPVGMGSRPGSVLPLHPSTDPSRTGTPTSTLGSNTSSIPPPPPASTGSIHGAKRRGARAKYVNVM
ncbi:vesicle coat component [Coemansia erecta]|nr:vesicle coat component [Coemansia erecta]